MKRLLFAITSVLILGLCIAIVPLGALAQTEAASTKTQQVPAKAQPAPAKRWKKPTTVPLAVAPAVRVDTVKNNDFSLNGQYQFLLSRSRSVNGYKLVNPYRLTAVWKSVTDTLTKERAELAKAKAKILEQTQTINGLQSEVKGNETEVADTNAKIDEINFIGLSFTKGTYNIIVWSIIGVLAIALIVVITRSAKNVLEARHRTQLYEEITSEYQAFKTKANEKERKLARELQDERNIIEEMRGRG